MALDAARRCRPGRWRAYAARRRCDDRAGAAAGAGRPTWSPACARLKLATIRRAGTRAAADRQDPTLGARGGAAHPLEAEIAARDASNAAARLQGRRFPVTKTLEEFKVAASLGAAGHLRLPGLLEWIRAPENLCLVGPAGTGKSHLLVALGHAAVAAGHRVRYLTAAELVETLYRGWPTTPSAG